MPNSQSINQTLPNFAATKNSTSAPELKTNNNNFNQVLKNEVVNKAKKINTEPQKNISAQNTKVHATPNGTSKTDIKEEKTEIQDADKHDSSDIEEQLPCNLSDPSSLLAFVNTVSTLAQTSKEDSTSNESNLTLSVLEQTNNSALPAPPIDDNNDKIDTEKLVETDQFGLKSDASNKTNDTSQDIFLDQQIGLLSTQKNSELKELQANTTSLTSKADVPSRIDTRNMPTAAHQVAVNEIINSAPAPALIVKEFKDQLGLQQSPPLNTTPGKIGVSTNAEMMDTNDAAVPLQSIEITQTSQELPIKASGEREVFTKDLNNQLTQEKQDVLKSIKSEARNELSLSANEPQKTEILTATPAIPAPPAVMGNTTITEHISPRVGSKGWDQAIGQKIVWMVAGGEQSAQLTLNPPDLGPVQVVLSINDNFVDASFVSSHLDVREAIEAAAPKLREMMDNAGISLSGFSVSAESAQSGNPFNAEKFQHSGGSGLRSAGTTSDTETDIPKLSTSTQNSNRELGLVDTFA